MAKPKTRQEWLSFYADLCDTFAWSVFYNLQHGLPAVGREEWKLDQRIQRVWKRCTNEPIHAAAIER